MQRFDNKVALITGAASGIGRAAAERLAQEGAAVFCVDIQKPALDELVAALRQKGAQAEAFVCDASDEQQVKACVARCVATYKKLDVLCNIAGILRFANTHEMPLNTFELVMKVNVTSTFLFCREALPELIKTEGNIVNTASTAAYQGLPWGAAYSASKSAILGMTRSIAVDYASHNVRANCVAPGDILTSIMGNNSFPDGADLSILRRVSSLTGPKGPDVIAGAIAMLASEDGIHITGECVRIDGGMLA